MPTFKHMLHHDPLWNASKFISKASWNTSWSKEHWFRDSVSVPFTVLPTIALNIASAFNLVFAAARCFTQSHPFISAGCVTGITAVIGGTIALHNKGSNKHEDQKSKMYIADGVVCAAIAVMSFGGAAVVNHIVR